MSQAEAAPETSTEMTNVDEVFKAPEESTEVVDNTANEFVVINEVNNEPKVGEHVGQCKWFNDNLGFGFLTVQGGEMKGKDIFVHHTAIKPLNSNYKSLKKGEYVNFDIVQGDNGLQASNVTGIGGGSLICDVTPFHAPGSAVGQPKPVQHKGFNHHHHHNTYQHMNTPHVAHTQLQPVAHTYSHTRAYNRFNDQRNVSTVYAKNRVGAPQQDYTARRDNKIAAGFAGHAAYTHHVQQHASHPTHAPHPHHQPSAMKHVRPWQRRPYQNNIHPNNVTY